MRVWRALKSTGCGVLRDGVYILPGEVPTVGGLAEAESEVKAAGGFAMTAEVNFAPAQLEHVRGLFDRGKDYAALLPKIAAAKAALPRLGKRKADTLVQRLRRALDELSETDFFPGQARLQATEAMTGVEHE